MLTHFGLEGHLMYFTRADYDEIVRNDIEGSNTDPIKASLLRSFALPERFITKNSSKEPRTVNFLGGFVSKTGAWMVVDFVRIAKLHVTSLSRTWNKQDLSVESPVRTVTRDH